MTEGIGHVRKKISAIGSEATPTPKMARPGTKPISTIDNILRSEMSGGLSETKLEGMCLLLAILRANMANYCVLKTHRNNLNGKDRKY